MIRESYMLNALFHVTICLCIIDSEVDVYRYQTLRILFSFPFTIFAILSITNIYGVSSEHMERNTIHAQQNTVQFCGVA